jgi:hypothetical protein
MTDTVTPPTRTKGVAVQIRWRATKSDGIGHAFTGKGPALCGEPNQEERYDWPRRERCVPCDAMARGDDRRAR